MIRNALLVIGMAIFVFAAHVANAASLLTKLPVLTVRGASGDLNRLPLRYERTDSHEPLRIVIGDDIPLGSRETIRGSVWAAAMAASMIKNDPLDGVRISIDFSGDVDGPSAGGIMCLAILLAMENKSVPDDFAMTGTILPDGSVGLVGGVAAKIRGAAGKGARRICIPAFERYEEQSNGDDLDLFKIGDELGVEVMPVKNVNEAYQIITGKTLFQSAEVDESDTLKLDRELDRRLTRFCEEVFKFDGGTNGPQHALARSKYEAEFLREAYEKSGFMYFANEHDIFIDGISKLSRNKILTAFRQACVYLNMQRYDELETSKWDAPLKFYRDISTNELAVVDDVVSHGRRIWICKDASWFWRENGKDGGFLSDPEKARRKSAMLDYVKFVRDRALDRVPKLSLSAILFEVRASAACSGGSPICLQGENALEMMSRVEGMSRNFNLDYAADDRIEALQDYELPGVAGRIINDYYRVVSLVDFVNDLSGLDVDDVTAYGPKSIGPGGALVDDSTNLLDMLSFQYTNEWPYAMSMNIQRPNARIDVCERSFYTALRAVESSIESDMRDAADKDGEAFSKAKSERLRSDCEFAHFDRWCWQIDRCHGRLAEQKDQDEREDSFAHSLYQSSQALGKAYALQIKYSHDAKKKGFVGYLIRMARAAALRSISECRSRGIVCLDPMLKFEMADEASGEGGDSIHDVLEYYWRAHLGAKALLMGFDTVRTPGME